MPTEAPINNPVLKTSNEHTLILDHLAEFEKASRVFSDGDFHRFLRENVPVMARELHRHFYYEESALYPALLLHVHKEDVIRDLLVLQKQHGVIEGFFEQLQELIDTGSLDENIIRSHFAPKLKKIIDMIRAHASIEVKKIFPTIAMNPLAVKYVEKKIADLTLS